MLSFPIISIYRLERGVSDFNRLTDPFENAPESLKTEEIYMKLEVDTNVV